jgi:excisionase family DNA binding protein
MNLMTVQDVAALLGVSKSLVYQLVETGKIACHKVGTGRGIIRFRDADVEAYLKSCRVEKCEQAPDGTAGFEPRSFSVYVTRS